MNSGTGQIISGTLRRVPLPRLLYRLHVNEFDGCLVLQHVELEKRVFFQRGVPVFISSNSVLERIGQFLMRNGDITEMDFHLAIANQEQYGGVLVEIMVRLGKLEQDRALQRLKEQASARIVDACRWGTGRFHCIYGEPIPQDRLDLNLSLPAVILEGIRYGYDLPRLKRLFAPYQNVRLVAGESPKIERAAFPLTELEREAAELLQPNTTLVELIKLILEHNVDPLTGMQVLYLFLQTDLAGLENLAPPATGLTFIGQIPSPFATSPELQGAVTKPASPPPDAVPPLAAGMGPAAPSVPAPFVPIAPPPPAPAVVSAQVKEMLAYADNLARQNFYDRLGLRAPGDDQQVKTAYVALAKKWHPDTHGDIGSPERAVCDKIFALITEAEQRLRTEAHRKEYDAALELSGGRADGVDISAIVEADQQFLRGKQLLKMGRLELALKQFAEAAKLNAKEEAFTTYLSWVQFLLQPKNENMREIALKRLTAINVDAKAKDPDAYFACGRIYKLIGDEQKAVECFKRCLAVDRNNIDAKRELRMYQMKKDKQPAAAPPAKPQAAEEK